MTVAARKVLADCRVAHKLLEEESNIDKWRVHWVGALSVIRAVGHVLQNVDGVDVRCRQASTELFREWLDEKESDHQIFQDFIKRERDLILKEYLTAVNLGEYLTIFVQPNFAEFQLD